MCKIKNRIDKLDDIKMRNFSLSKDINKREKRQAEWRGYMEYLPLASEFVSRMRNEQTNTEETDTPPQKKRARGYFMFIAELYSLLLPISGCNRFVPGCWHSPVAGLED